MLKIEKLHVRVAGKEILKGLSLSVNAGEVHAIMGPNGAGKSTLGNVLVGREGYEVVEGSVTYEGADLLALEPEARAAAGVFLAFQYPVEIPGVNNTYFLRAALNAQRKARGEAELDSMQFLKRVREKLAVLHLKDELLHRAVNEGFSGGEKKRNEIFQMALLEPKLAILDETDSGLDIDALKMVADGVNAMRDPARAFVVITHYQRLLDYIVPDFVHVLADGRIVQSGDKSLALKLEEEGYAWVAQRRVAGAACWWSRCSNRCLHLRPRPMHQDRTGSVQPVVMRARSSPAMDCQVRAMKPGGTRICARWRSAVTPMAMHRRARVRSIRLWSDCLAWMARASSSSMARSAPIFRACRQRPAFLPCRWPPRSPRVPPRCRRASSSR